jgi:hypothetical protein
MDDKLKNFQEKYHERYGGLRKAEITMLEKYKDELDYLRSFCFCPCEGEGIYYLNSLGKKVVGINVNQLVVSSCPFPGLMKEGSITNIPLKDKEFECSISLDLFEHLSLDQAIKAMRELMRVSELSIVICVAGSDGKWFYNDPTHKIWWPFEVWKTVLSELAKESGFKLTLCIPEEEMLIFKYFEE